MKWAVGNEMSYLPLLKVSCHTGLWEIFRTQFFQKIFSLNPPPAHFEGLGRNLASLRIDCILHVLQKRRRKKGRGRGEG